MAFRGDFAAATAYRRLSLRRGSLAGFGAAAVALAVALPCAAQSVASNTPAPLAVPALPSVPAAAPASAAAAALRPTLREGVAAVVNDEIISTYDLRQRVLLLIVSSGLQVTDDTLRELQRQALRDLVDERLKLQEVRRIQQRTKTNGLEPTPQELDEQINRMAQSNGLTGAQLVSQLAAAGVDKGAITSQLQAEISWQRYVGGRFGGSIKIGDDQIAAAMKRAEASASKTQYQVAEIFIDDQRAGGPAQAMAGARQLLGQLQQGAPFAGVARQFSNATSAAAGGDAGWLASGDIPAPVEEALEKIRPGQLTPPIAVNGGVYILMLRDKRSGVGATMVNLKQAAVRLTADASPADIDAAKAKLDALKGKINSCAALDAEAGKVDGVVAGDLGETDVNDLSESFRNAISNLKVDQVSDPVRTNAGLHLVALCGKRNTGPTQLTKQEIEDRLTEQELEMIAKRELRNLRNSASIENR